MSGGVETARAWLADLQERICAGLQAHEPSGAFRGEELELGEGRLTRPRILEDGDCLERAAVNFSHTRGPSLPSAATARRPELEGRRYEAVSVSLIVHPRNPYAPTTHANLRWMHFRRGCPISLRGARSPCASRSTG